MQNNNFSKVVPLSLGVLVLSLVLGYAVLAWMEPGQPPPNNSIAAPINTSATAQTKTGPLTIGGSNWAQIQLYPSLYDIYNPVSGASDTAHFHFGFPGTPAGKKPLLEIPGDLWVIGADKNLAVDGTTKAAKICLGGQCCSSWAECTALAGSCVKPPAPVPGACNNNLPAKNLRIFVGGSFTGNQVSTVGQADSLCQSLANNYGVPGTYRALMYYGEGTRRNPMDVLASDARYWNANRSSESDPNCLWNLIANNPNDFFDANGGGNYLKNAIYYNEKGLAANVSTWSNLRPLGNGNWQAAAAYGCGMGQVGVCTYCGAYYGYGNWGNSTVANGGWANAGSADFNTCCCMTQTRSLYCVQQREAKDNVAGPCSAVISGTQKRVFVTSKTYTGNQVSTVQQADAICQQHASNAQMPGTYRALMYYGEGTTRNPYDVLNSGASFWTCGTDGDPASGNYSWKKVAQTRTDFFTNHAFGYLEYPIKYDEMGKPTDSTISVWSNFIPLGNGNWQAAAAYGCGMGQVGVCTYCGAYYGYGNWGSSFSTDAGWANSGSADFNTCCCMTQSRALHCVEQ